MLISEASDTEIEPITLDINFYQAITYQWVEMTINSDLKEC